MGLILAVVIDAHEKQIPVVLCHFRWILAAVNLVDGGVGIMVEFQLKDDGERIDVLTWDEHQVSE